MRLETAALVLMSSVTARADNTPNLCSADIPNLQRIAPSATGVMNIPNITVGSATYNGDADHFVMIPNDDAVDKVMVYIPGTTDRPELSSCLLQSVAATLDYPTIGLSYAYLSSGDSFRNGKCESLPTLAEQVECLDEQHKDALYGGDYGATHFRDGKAFWVAIDPSNSLAARLGKLFEYLNMQNPGKGWDSLCKEDSEPDWSRIALMGHSQGAGHVAYLGKTKDILGGVMISGPQDECIGCPDGTKFWIDEEWTTKHVYTAFSSGDEPLYGVQSGNWARMTAAGAVDWGEPTSVDFALAPVSACSPLYTTVKYGDTSTCGGKEHCSTAIDDSVPYLNQTDGTMYRLYGKYVWPALAEHYSTCAFSSCHQYTLEESFCGNPITSAEACEEAARCLGKTYTGTVDRPLGRGCFIKKNKKLQFNENEPYGTMCSPEKKCVCYAYDYDHDDSHDSHDHL